MWDPRVVLGEEGVAATFIFEHQLAFAAVAAGAVRARVERFGRRGTEPFEPFEPFEFFQNRNFPEFSGIFLRTLIENSKISENFNIF